MPPLAAGRSDRLPAILAGGVATGTALLWLAGGGLGLLGNPSGAWLATGQILGLTAALAALAGIVLVARPTWLERRAGLDELWRWHRWAGVVTVLALAGHVVASSTGFADGRLGRAIPEIVSLMATTPWMVAAVVAAVLFFTVALTSWKRLRQRMSYETWLGVHVVGYLAVLLGFGHQLAVGSSMTNAAMRWWWIGIAAITLAVVAWSRLGGLLRAAVGGRGVVTGRYPASADAVALEIRATGRRVARAKAGQFFLLRVLTKDLWWQAHPISLSAGPADGRLRFTVRDLGDGSRLMGRVAPGTQVVLEGPYGTFTADRAAGRPVLLVGGGVGLTPLRALLADCTPAQTPVVVARVRDRVELPHESELIDLVAARNGRMYVLDGPRSRWNQGRPFEPDQWRAAVPDLLQRDVFVCGPESLRASVERGLRGAGVPGHHIHVERFGGAT